VRPRAWARLDALQLTLLDAAMAGDVKAAAAILQIVLARVPPNGLEPARDGFKVKSGTPRTMVMHPTR
jgi:hypothetical protein